MRRLWKRWKKIPWVWRWILGPLFCVVAFYSVENFRGWWALKKYRENCEAAGEWFYWEDRPEIPRPEKGENLLDYQVIREAIADEEFDFSSVPELEMLSWDNYPGMEICVPYPFQIAFPDEKDSTPQKCAKAFLEAIEKWEVDLEQVHFAIGNANSIWEGNKGDWNDHQCRILGELILHRARARIVLGNGAGAFSDLADAFRLSEFFMAKEFLLDRENGISLKEVGLAVIWEGLKTRVWNEAELEQIAQFQYREISELLPGKVFMTLRASSLFFFEKYDSIHVRITKGNPVLWDPFGHHHGFYHVNWIPNQIPFASKSNGLIDQFLFIVTPDGWFDLWAIKYCEEMRAISDVPKVDIPGGSAIWEVDSTSIAFPNIWVSGESKATLTRQRLAKVAIASELFFIQHGRYPKNTAELIPNYLPAIPPDPYSDQPVIYLPAGTRNSRPVVYSIGENEVDDGGIPMEQSDLGDIVWHYELPEGFTVDDYDQSAIPKKIRERYAPSSQP